MSVPCVQEPILVRLFFEVRPEQMASFEKAYREQLLPILKRRGLRESAEQGRPTPDRIFSRMFAFRAPYTAFEKAILEANEGSSTRELGREPEIR